MVAKVLIQVVGEADRLLTQSFQDWLDQILVAAQPPPFTSLQTHEKAPTTIVGDDHGQIPHHNALVPIHLNGTAYNGNVVLTADFDGPLYSSCQEMLFSATLRSDPSKTAELNLRDAKWFVVKGKFEDVDVPTLLDEGFELPLEFRVRRGNVYLTSRYANLVH